MPPLVYGYWNHSIATQLNPAAEGSPLLGDLQTISAIGAWLAPFKFVGIALVLTGIGPGPDHHRPGAALAGQPAVGPTFLDHRPTAPAWLGWTGLWKPVRPF